MARKLPTLAAAFLVAAASHMPHCLAQEKLTAPVQMVMACAHGSHDEITSDGAYLCRSVDLLPRATPPAPLPAPSIQPRVFRPKTEPVLLYTEEPAYPMHAATQGVEGSCLIGLVVDTTGQPANLRVLKSVSPELDQAAMEAVSHYKFKPATYDGKPIQAQLSVQVAFHVASR